jgi:hypothetical protein
MNRMIRICVVQFVGMLKIVSHIYLIQGQTRGEGGNVGPPSKFLTFLYCLGPGALYFFPYSHIATLAPPQIHYAGWPSSPYFALFFVLFSS